MATKKKAAGKQKAASKKAQGNTIKAPASPFQTDDPIIVKPGGSLTIEWDKAFDEVYDPGGKKEGKKHKIATRLRQVVILDKAGKVKQRVSITDAEDQVMICYDTPNGCECK